MSEEREFYDIVDQGATGCPGCECDRCTEKFYDWDDPLNKMERELEEVAHTTRVREHLWWTIWEQEPRPQDLVDLRALMHIVHAGLRDAEKLLKQSIAVLYTLDEDLFPEKDA